MERDQTKYVFLTALASLIVIAVVALALSAHWGGVAQGRHIIFVSAAGAAAAYPGEAQIFIIANGTGASAGLAVQNLSATMGALNSTLQQYVLGNTTNMQTVSYSVTKPKNSTAYMASEELMVTIPGINNTAAALVSATSVPNVYIDDVRASLTPFQAESLRTAAVQAALLNATMQAEAVSNSIQLQNVSISGAYIFQPFGAAMTGASLTAGSEKASLNSLFYGGKDSVIVNVQAQFAYK